jgi:hypothetical protein
MQEGLVFVSLPLSGAQAQYKASVSDVTSNNVENHTDDSALHEKNTHVDHRLSAAPKLTTGWL